jgi:hypothetical protein
MTPTPNYCWLDDFVYEAIEATASPKRQFAPALLTYRALVIIATDCGCAPGPGIEGKPFAASVRTIAEIATAKEPTKSSIGVTWGSLRHLAEIGVIDPFDQSSDPDAMLTFQIRRPRRVRR